MASRASVELHTLIYFRKRPTDAEARIIKMRSNGFIVFVPKYGIEGPVYLTRKEKPKESHSAKGSNEEVEWIVNEEHQTVTKADKSVSYKVLEPVTTHIEVVEPQPNRPKLQLTLIKV